VNLPASFGRFVVIFEGGYPPHAPLGTPRGTQAEFEWIFDGFRLPFSRPLAARGPHFQPEAPPARPRGGKHVPKVTSEQPKRCEVELRTESVRARTLCLY